MTPEPPAEFAERIVLPKSGVVLTKGGTHAGCTDWHLAGMMGGTLVLRDCGSERWSAWWPDSITHSATLARCVEFLDENVLALRAALLPADARERIIDPILSAWFGLKRADCNEPEIADARMLADEILRALGAGERGREESK